MGTLGQVDMVLDPSESNYGTGMSANYLCGYNSPYRLKYVFDSSHSLSIYEIRGSFPDGCALGVALFSRIRSTSVGGLV